MRSTRLCLILLVVFACERCLAWYGDSERSVFSSYGRPVDTTEISANGRFLLTCHKGGGGFYIFMFQNGKCIARSQFKQSFTSAEVGNLLTEFRGMSGWKVMESDRSFQGGIDQEWKAWRRRDLKFFAFTLEEVFSSGAGWQVVSLGNGRASLVGKKHFSTIYQLAFQNYWR